jgi:hypothetical protein
MPRDPERIKRIVRLVERIWKKLPDLRLMQLLGNCYGPCDPYYKEDDKLEEMLKEYYKEYVE